MLLKMLWPWQLRLRALLAMHVSLDTHSALPHLIAAVHAPQFAHHAPDPAGPDADIPATTPARPAAGACGTGARRGDGMHTAPWLPEAAVAMVGQCLGWARAGICWWLLDSVQARIALDLGTADDVGQLQRLCAFHRASRCSAGGQHGTDGRPGFFVAASVAGVEVPTLQLQGLNSVEQVRCMAAPGTRQHSRCAAFALW